MASVAVVSLVAVVVIGADELFPSSQPTKAPTTTPAIVQPTAVQPAAVVQPVAALPAKPKPAPKQTLPPELARPSAPAPVKFDIAGMRIGDPLTDEFAYHHCPVKDKGKPDITGNESIEIEGAKVFVLYQFKDKRLIGVSLSFNSSLFPTLVKAYTKKFGSPPHEVSTSIVTTNAGVNHQNEKVVWQTDSGPFQIEKYGNKITDGFATLQSPESVQYWKDKVEKKTNELKGKL